MSAQSYSGNDSSNSSGDAMGRLLMIALAILAALPLIIGYWAAISGGGL